MTDEIDLPVWDTVRDPTVEIETSGTVLKPFADILGMFLKEVRLRYTEDGLSVTATDASNVALIDLQLPADAFNSYDLTRETAIGISVSSLRGCIRRARMHTDDTLSLSVSPDELRATVRRDDMVTTDATRTIDPDSVREDPTLSRIRDSDDFNYAPTTFDIGKLTEGVSHVLDAAEYVRFGSQDGKFIMEAETDITTTGVRFEDIEPNNNFHAIFSGDFMSEISAACKKTRAETATVWCADEAPLFVEINREIDGDLALDVSMMLAPRIQS
jgi:proliferating cell nuclear antigen